MIRVLTPVGAVQFPAATPHRGVAALDGLRLGFADNRKFNVDLLLETVEQRLAAAHGIRRAGWVKKNATGPMPEDGLTKLREESDAVIAAIGD